MQQEPASNVGLAVIASGSDASRAPGGVVASVLAASDDRTSLLPASSARSDDSPSGMDAGTGGVPPSDPFVASAQAASVATAAETHATTICRSHQPLRT